MDISNQLCMLIYCFASLYLLSANGEERKSKQFIGDKDDSSVDNSDSYSEPSWDPNGYVLFCLCMGRIGNKIDHLLGGMAFAKGLNRTLVLPPFRTYRNVPFTEWFDISAMAAYHRVVTAEDFMARLAPAGWPPGTRRGFCWLPHSSTSTCSMVGGEPFTGFWAGLGVEFDEIITYHIGFYEHNYKDWNKLYPAYEYPVIAMRGAPASYPVQERHRHLQQHLVFSQHIQEDAQNYINKHFKGQKFIGIHLRNGMDWENACKHVDSSRPYMSSTQCSSTGVSADVCLPSHNTVLRQVKQAVEKTGARLVFVATDKNPMIQEITDSLKPYKVGVYHMDPELPLLDLAVLEQSTHFIGNCVSSFTAFVKRARDVKGKTSEFFGM